MAISRHHHPKYIKTMSAKGKAGQLNIHELEHLSRRKAVVMAAQAQKAIQGKVRVPCKTRPNTSIYIDKDQVSEYMTDYKKPQSDVLKRLYA
jgi:ABC-type uncharacterized transport system ATPase subunit